MRFARRAGGGSLVRGTHLLAMLVVGLGATSPALAATSTPAPTPTPSGSLLWSDDFRSSASGWETRTFPSGAVFAYGSGEYLITPGPGVDDLSQAPYGALHAHLIISVDVALPAGGSSDLRGGVVCGRPTALGSHYVFFLGASGDWSILRVPRLTQQHAQSLQVGSMPNFPQGTSVSMTALCSDHDSTSEGSTTELSLFLNGSRVAHVLDTWSAVPGSGWRAALDAGPGTATPQEVSFRNFSLRNADPGSAAIVPSGPPLITTTAAFIVGGCVLSGLIVLAIVLWRGRRAPVTSVSLPESSSWSGGPPAPPSTTLGPPAIPPPPGYPPVPPNPT